MKLQFLGRALLAVAAAGLTFGLTSCSNNRTVGYIYVLGTTANGQPSGQIGSYREDNNAGTVTPIVGGAIGSGGLNPVRAVVPSGNRFVYVLNQGQQSAPDANGSVTFSDANISLFSVGGFGNLAQQLQYNSQGLGSRRLAVDSGGSHLYVLDEFSPVGITNGGISSPTAVPNAGNPDYPCLGTDGFYHPVGDITVFTLDGTNGRLQIVQNQRQQNLTYFPVGCFPVDFRVTSSYVFTFDAGSTSNNDVNTVNVQQVAQGTGQLTPTQTAPQFIGSGLAVPPTITAVNGFNNYIYLIDTPNNRIFPFTIGTNGALTAIPGNSPFNNPSTQAGGPVQTATDSVGRFLYVLNGGPAGGVNNNNADLAVYNIDPGTGALNATVQGSPFNLVSGTVSGPVCIFEDPTNQYIYTAGSVDNSITGRRLDPNTGVLRVLRGASTFPVVGTPSWCLGFSSSF